MTLIGGDFTLTEVRQQTYDDPLEQGGITGTRLGDLLYYRRVECKLKHILFVLTYLPYTPV